MTQGFASSSNPRHATTPVSWTASILSRLYAPQPGTHRMRVYLERTLAAMRAPYGHPGSLSRSNSLQESKANGSTSRPR